MAGWVGMWVPQSVSSVMEQPSPLGSLGISYPSCCCLHPYTLGLVCHRWNATPLPIHSPLDVDWSGGRSDPSVNSHLQLVL